MEGGQNNEKTKILQANERQENPQHFMDGTMYTRSVDIYKKYMINKTSTTDTMQQ